MQDKGKAKALSVSLRTEESVAQCYMRRVRGGGMVIYNDDEFNIGDEVLIMLSMVNCDGRIPVSCRVVWINPKDGSGGSQMIGLQFVNDRMGANEKMMKIVSSMPKETSTISF